MNKDSTITVTGASGFIGGHLVKHLIEQGFTDVRAIGRRPVTHWKQRTEGAHEMVLDLKMREECDEAIGDAEYVFHLAAFNGGIAYLNARHFEAMAWNSEVDMQVLDAARRYSVKRFVYASSACVYAESDMQRCLEQFAVPADPANGYGWSKIYGEQAGLASGVPFVAARLQTIFGTHCDIHPDRSKVVAAICVKIAEAKIKGEKCITLHGNGKQGRTFTSVENATKALEILATTPNLDYTAYNVGTSRIYLVYELARMIMEIAGVMLDIEWDTTKFSGVRIRGCDNERMRKLGWHANGGGYLETTYKWVEAQVSSSLSAK